MLTCEKCNSGCNCLLSLDFAHLVAAPIYSVCFLKYCWEKKILNFFHSSLLVTHHVTCSEGVFFMSYLTSYSACFLFPPTIAWPQLLALEETSQASLRSSKSYTQKCYLHLWFPHLCPKHLPVWLFTITCDLLYQCAVPCFFNLTVKSVTCKMCYPIRNHSAVIISL